MIIARRRATGMQSSLPFTLSALIGVVIMVLGSPGDTHAAIDSSGLLDNALTNFQTSAAGWATYITTRASWLFWTLAVISLVWTMGQMALRRAELGEFVGEVASFSIMTGFFWWLLTNGPAYAVAIMNSMRQIAGNASGLGPNVYPSSLVDIGFQLLDKVMIQTSVWEPIVSAINFIVCLVVLIVVALIGVNMLVMLVSGWILAFAGIFFLGFGGSRWTSDMAINYYRTVLALGAQLAGMVLVVGIGYSFINNYYVNMSGQVRTQEMAVLMIAAVILLGLVNKIPPLLGGLAMGGGVGALGSGVSLGSMVGTAMMMGATMGTAGAMAAAGMANVASGTKALIAAAGMGNMAGSTDGPPRMGGGSASGGVAGGPSSGPAGGGGSSGGFPLTAAMGGPIPPSPFPDPPPSRGGNGSPGPKGRVAAETVPPSEPTFSGDSLSKGTSDKTFDPAAEIAAFRDRPPTTNLKGGNT